MERPDMLLVLACLFLLTIAPSHGANTKTNTCSMTEPGIPLGQTHAHNTYEHPYGIFDAVAAGFCSFEADFFFNGSALWISHDQDNIRSDWTMQSKYLNPFVNIIKLNGGTVYPASKVFGGCKSIILLCDAKEYNDDTSEEAARRQFDALHRVLAQYQSQHPGLFTVYNKDGTIQPGIISAYVSGLRPSPDYVAAIDARPLALDGRLENLKPNSSQYGPSVYPLVSQGFDDVCPDKAPPDNATMEVFNAYEVNCMKKHADLIRSYIDEAHKQHRVIRFWNTADTPEMWGLLIEYGVDYVNVDALQQFRAYAFQQWGQVSALQAYKDKYKQHKA